MFQPLFLLSLLQLFFCDEKSETTQLLGVNTVHDESIKIDKDTIITRNLKLKYRGTQKQAVKDSKGEPDWSYSAIPEEIGSYVEAFKRNMSECLKEVQSNDARPVKRLSPRTDSPVHGECLIACVLKRNGVIEKGKVNKNNLLALVNKFFVKDAKLMKKLDKNLDKCVAMSARHADECDLAAKLNACTNDLMAYNKHKITVNY